MRKSTVSDCRLIELNSFSDARGRLLVFETSRALSFAIRRFFILDRMKPKIVRGDHAHKKCHQFFLIQSGRPAIRLKDGRRSRLLKPLAGTQLLHVPPGVWVEVAPKSKSDQVLVLCSHAYDSKDYLRTWTEFLKFKSRSEK